MKILEVVDFFKPSWEAGGIARVCYEMSKSLVEEGHDITVYTTDGFKKRLNVPKNISVDVDGIKTYYFENTFNVLTRNNYYSPYYLPIIARKDVQNYDIVHIHTFRSPLAVCVAHYARYYHVPYVLQPHGSFPRIIEKQGLKRIFDMVWGDRILKGASRIVAVSGAEAEQYHQAGIPDEKIVVIPNGFNPISFADLPPAGQFREQYNIREKHIILYVGRLHKQKGLDFLIRAFQLFVQSRAGDDVALVLVGPDDGYKVVLLDLVTLLGLSGKVRFVDYFSPVGFAYQDADILVYPSVNEIFGLVPFEALLCGTPVIVTDDCGCGEFIKEAGCGHLVRYGDVAGLSETLSLALEHGDVNKRMVGAGRRYIEEHFMWEKVVKQVEAMYECCVRNV
jgi:glycosyltransferase involved in cell wall biosynthesis